MIQHVDPWFEPRPDQGNSDSALFLLCIVQSPAQAGGILHITEERCNGNSSGYTHGPPWSWPRSEILLSQINNFFTKPEKLALKQPVLDLVDRALTTTLPDAENDAIRQANSNVA